MERSHMRLLIAALVAIIVILAISVFNSSLGSGNVMKQMKPKLSRGGSPVINNAGVPTDAIDGETRGAAGNTQAIGLPPGY